MEARADYSNKQSYSQPHQAHGTRPNAQEQEFEKKTPNAHENRASGEEMAGKKGFSFIQKAGLAGAGITGALFFIKSKILTALSFLTAVPTAGLLYFGFFRAKKPIAPPKEPVQESPKQTGPSKETLDQIQILNSLKEDSKGADFKDFTHKTIQAMASTNTNSPDHLAKELVENIGYQADRKTIRKLQSQLHPDKHLQASDDNKKAYNTLFKTISSVKELANQ